MHVQDSEMGHAIAAMETKLNLRALEQVCRSPFLGRLNLWRLQMREDCQRVAQES